MAICTRLVGAASSCGGLLWIVAAVAIAPATAVAQFGPGLLVDPPGLEQFVAATYNPVEDEYFITYAGDEALALRLSPCGEIVDEVAFFDQPADNAVSQVAATYNPDRDEYLAVIRLADPNQIFARYLDGRGEPVGEPFSIGTGSGPEVHYSPLAARYVVAWERSGGGNRRSWVRSIDADSGAETPVLGSTEQVDSDVISIGLAYGSQTDQFLAVYTHPGESNEDNVGGRFIAADGTPLDPGLILAGGPRTQHVPRVAYAASSDRWLVSVADWINANGDDHRADVNALLVDATGTVHERFFISDPVAGGWDAPGPLVYHPTTDRFYATWYLEPSSHMRSVDPTDGSLGPTQVVVDDGGITAMAIRPHALNPQVLITWKPNFNGVYAHIINLSGECTDQAEHNDASVVRADLPSTMGCGSAASAEIVMQNTGETVWTRSDGYFMGAVGDGDPLRQDPRVWLQAETRVPPGSSHAFSLELLAPPTAGIYPTAWQMVQQPAGFFGEIAAQSVTVTCSDPFPPGDDSLTSDAGGDPGPRGDGSSGPGSDAGGPDGAAADEPGDEANGSGASRDARLEGGCGCGVADSGGRLWVIVLGLWLVWPRRRGSR